MAIVIPHPQHLHNYLASNGKDSSRDISDLCEDPAVAELVLKECNAIGKKSRFKQFELLQAVVLTPDEWTPESGLVTAAQKIQRAKIAKTFKDKIDVCFRPGFNWELYLKAYCRKFTFGLTRTDY